MVIPFIRELEKEKNTQMEVRCGGGCWWGKLWTSKCIINSHCCPLLQRLTPFLFNFFNPPWYIWIFAVFAICPIAQLHKSEITLCCVDVEGGGCAVGHYSLTPSTFPPYVFDTFTPCEWTFYPLCLTLLPPTIWHITPLFSFFSGIIFCQSFMSSGGVRNSK